MNGHEVNSIETLIDSSHAQGFLHDLDLDKIRSMYEIEMQHAWLKVELDRKFKEIIYQSNFDHGKFSLLITIKEKK